MAQITDKDGQNWVVKFSTEDLLDAFCELNITLESFQDINKMNAGALFKMVWYGVRPLAKARKVSKSAFWKLFPTERLTDLAEVVGKALEEAFPEPKKEEGEDNDSPPVPGASAT